MLPLLLLTILVTAASGIPFKSAYVSTNDPTGGGLPIVGDIWGPVITHAGVMIETDGGRKHRYLYSSQGKEDIIADSILPTEIFQKKGDMYRHIKSMLTDDFVVVQIDPAALEGKFLEVLSSKVIPADAVKIVCHSFKTTPAFCHNLENTNHEFKLIYSMVRDTDNGKVFPTVFASHQGCARDNNRQLKCYWVSHVNEIIVLDKRVI